MVADMLHHDTVVTVHDGVQDSDELNGINEGIHDIVNSFPEGSHRKYSTIKHILSCRDLSRRCMFPFREGVLKNRCH